MKLALTEFSVKHPVLVSIFALMLTFFMVMQFPKVQFDNDPENMLSKDEHVRVFHNQVKEEFSLYDFVIVGIVNNTHPDGIFNVETLRRVYDLTDQLLNITQSDDKKPVITIRAQGGKPERKIKLDLSPAGKWKKVLAKAFHHNPNNLFDEHGNSAIIAREIISPSVVDNIKQADQGSLKLEYLMENPPETRGEALSIRDDAMNNPLYNGTLVSEDQKAVCLYIPIAEKTYSYNVANLIKELTADWKGEDKVYITGLPVAEDTFGVEMLVQMAVSAPLAGLAIFLLLLLFFRRISLIIAPMIVAILSVICTMGLLIGLGFDVHIMSSMIAIFLMPIAVADSVHILSEFFDVYHKFNDKAKTIKHVIGHLFAPMLYTTLTTIAGFASLATTPIPPVRVFGLHVAFGVALAWLLTMTLIPSYIMLAVSEKSLRNLRVKKKTASQKEPALNRVLERLGSFSYLRWKHILSVTLVLVGISIYGISKIKVNDNPVKWFTENHSIRIADKVLNGHFGGTYTAYLTLSVAESDGNNWAEKTGLILAEAEKRFRTVSPKAVDRFLDELRVLEPLYSNVSSGSIKKYFVELTRKAEEIDNKTLESWNNLADTINYLEPSTLTYSVLMNSVNNAGDVKENDKRTLIADLGNASNMKGDKLLNKALEVCDKYTRLSFREFVLEMEAELTAPLFKQPQMLRYVEQLQSHLSVSRVVGKTTSVVDALKKASYELNYISSPENATDAEREVLEKRNKADFSVPNSAAAVGQVFTQLEGMKKKDALFHLVTKNYQKVNLWVQLKSGDNKDMEHVVEDLKEFMRKNRAPVEINAGWAGLTYLNVVWQDKMVVGMLYALGSSFVVVLIMMMVLFRSPLYGLLSMIPLSVTIMFIYGLIGLSGKDYDMPVAILSALTLGLSIDFAIHFLQRAREIQKAKGNWGNTIREMFKEPAMAISRNAVTISIGFTPLLLAPLVPYKTVGFFLATIMAVSWVATLFILSALITMLRKIMFKEGD
ncbi:RND family transporter [Verrucomicrobiota bacterium]